MDLSKLLYYLNQGGPAAQAALCYAAYYGYQLIKTLVDEMKTLNASIEKQNALLEQKAK